MALQLPTVTIDDLRAFHAQHFTHAPAPEHILHGVQPATEAEAAEEYYEEDDGLGYYPDGKKRTLTDEQIAMFRHSEIHAILRKRKLRKENDELSEGELDRASPASLGADTDKSPASQVEEPKKQRWATTSAQTKLKNKRKRKAYAERRKAKRLERGLPRRRSQRDGESNGEGEGEDEDDESDEWDPWHQANGPDVLKDETLDLDY